MRRRGCLGSRQAAKTDQGGQEDGCEGDANEDAQLLHGDDLLVEGFTTIPRGTTGGLRIDLIGGTSSRSRLGTGCGESVA
jgi:hypothetical protein